MVCNHHASRVVAVLHGSNNSRIQATTSRGDVVFSSVVIKNCNMGAETANLQVSPRSQLSFNLVCLTRPLAEGSQKMYKREDSGLRIAVWALLDPIVWLSLVGVWYSGVTTAFVRCM